MKNITYSIILLLSTGAVTCQAQKEKVVVFEPGKVYEVFLYKITDKDKLQNEYSPRAKKIAKEFGVKHIATFDVATINFSAGAGKPRTVSIFEFEDIDTYRRFQNDLDYVKLKGIRNSSIGYVAQGVFATDEQVAMPLDKTLSYDFNASWTVPENMPNLDKYFEKVGPIAVEKYGFNPSAGPFLKRVSYDGNWNPDFVKISTWPDPNAINRFFQNESVYKEVEHLRESAIPVKDVMQLTYIK